MSTTAASIPQAQHAGELERYTFHERLMHWSTAVTYLYCLGTGLAFYSPHLFWLAYMLGGAPTSRFWHPIVGIGFVLASFWMHAAWGRDMAMTEVDKRWLNNTEAYITNDEEHTRLADRFNGGQKLYYWLMIYGALLLVLSGAFLWFPEYIPRQFAWVRGVMILTHEVAALATIGGLIIHVYMSVFMVPYSMTAITTGYVTRAWAWTHHRLWYLRVTGQK
ncbi:MAG: formate dehydrogenase subunit gamma [Bryobacteraceae bacterium]